MKKGLFVVLAIIILTAAVNADTSNFSIQSSYDWLIGQQTNGNYGSIINNAAAILALKSAGYNPTTTANYLAEQENEQHCWPESGCKTKDTAFVILANKLMGVSTDEAAEWVKSAQSAALQTGNWWLEVATTDEGSCIIKYTKNGQETEKTINVNNGRFPNCGNTTFLNINNCIETNLVKNFPTLKLYVDCGTLSDALISLIYNSANSYYLISESQNKVAEISIENGCLGIGYKGSCDYESTLYANWASAATESRSISKIYLQDNYDKTNALHSALLYLIFNDKAYLENLKSRQRSDGSWDGDVYKTAMAVLAMNGESDYSSEFNKGVSWLKTKQRTDGSFGDVTTTAMVLYGVFTEGGIEFPSCTNGKEDPGERGVDCGGVCEEYDDCCSNDETDEGESGKDCGGVCEECYVCDKDDECDTDQGEDCQNCPDDCETCDDLCDNGEQDVGSGEEGIDCGGKCPRKCGEEVCDNNGICDINLVESGRSENENIDNCPNDCQIGDGICDDMETYENSPDDCPKLENCGDGTCDDIETEENCPQDCGEECNTDGVCDENEGCSCEDCENEAICKEESKFPWTFVVILLILLLAVAGYLIYKKKKTSKKNGLELFGFGKPMIKKMDVKEFKPVGPIKPVGTMKETKEERITMVSPRTAQKPSRIEEELEKSIKEAKKLIGKK